MFFSYRFVDFVLLESIFYFMLSYNNWLLFPNLYRTFSYVNFNYLLFCKLYYKLCLYCISYCFSSILLLLYFSSLIIFSGRISFGYGLSISPLIKMGFNYYFFSSYSIFLFKSTSFYFGRAYLISGSLMIAPSEPYVRLNNSLLFWLKLKLFYVSKWSPFWLISILLSIIGYCELLMLRYDFPFNFFKTYFLRGSLSITLLPYYDYSETLLLLINLSVRTVSFSNCGCCTDSLSIWAINLDFILL